MYTQCPDCETALRVSADVLRQAAGKVRCGGCGRAFNALLYLSETRPETRPRPNVQQSVPELTPEIREATPPPLRPPISAEQSRELLKTLDQLAGDEVRLEDTGVEWRLLGDEDGYNDDGVFAGRNGAAASDFDFGTGEDSVMDVEESEGDVIDFSFGDSLAGGEDAPNDVFADTNTPIDSGIFASPANSTVDELLDDTPTPVDEILSDSPSDVEAEEVFAGNGAADIDDEEIFAPPPPRPEDVLRFDDNTGLPENFDFDSAPAAASVPETTPDRPPQAEARPPKDEIPSGDPSEWIDLLDEVEPPAAAPGAECEVFADTGAQIALEDSDSEPAGTLSLAEELAALPDDYDDEEDEGDLQAEIDVEVEPAAKDAEPDDDPLAAAGIDLSGIYASPAPATEAEDDESPAEESAGAPADAAGEPASAQSADDVALDELTLESADEEFAAVRDAAADEDRERESGFDIDLPVQSFPSSTGELEFELEKSQHLLSPDDVEFDPTRTIVPTPTEEEQTVNMLIDADLMRFAITDDEGMASTLVLEDKAARKRPAGDTEAPDGAPPDALFETIIMEGAFARTAFEQERLAAEAEARARQAQADAQLAARQAAEQARKRRLHMGLIAAVVALVVLLAGQFVHQSRAELATVPAVGDAIAPIYRAVGAPITPKWNVKGWRFEVTSGSTSGGATAGPTDLPDLTPGSEVLTIRSRLGNQSEEALPYPLITLALTDRFEEVIGSKVLEPADYLNDGISSREMVQPGATFDATIAVAAPAESAAGFKLNVCYRHEGGGLRCALDDFR